ncbi:oxygen tolerance protein BatD [Luteibacter sp. OK325]|uniref:BatD family protein n=1 Tax=Luteibacter sp. OK325 TaxID=2135670 RepID=UPI000D3D05F0|nr:BatD family protein [Luteibacter sp. OK325]PTR35008.1 oxygen tolerance protein BatD [Luteibacter sp. OK325]
MRYLMLALALAMPSLAVAQSAPPVASLDRSTVGVGETVTLNIEIGDESADAPDLSPLTTDFVVLGTSTNHSLSIVNGRREAHTILGVALRPRHEGQLTVPALAIGGQRTQPVSLAVAASSDTNASAADRPVVLEGKAEPIQAYVGQQIDYTLRLYFAVNLADGQLGDPSAEGAEIRRVGQDANYQSTRGGRRFNVIERHYAIFPQRAGSLEIQPPTFQGTAVDPSDAGSFFGAGAPVSAVADRLHVTVRERPSSAPDAAWIPARELKLALEGMPVDGKGRIGQPITLTMRLDAVGMPFEALPALSLPKIDGADVYPDKAVTGGGTSGAWVTGRRQQGFAVVPTRSGTLHIPETTLHWWNVVTDKAEVATLPARDIEVVAGAGATPLPAVGGSVARPSAGMPATAAPTSSIPSTPWRWFFLAAVVLWLVTIAAWVIFGRRRPAPGAATPVPSEPVRERPAREAFLSSTSADPATMDRLLLAWARTVRPSLRSTGALSAALGSEEQRTAITMLQRARFAGGAVDGAALKAAFTRGLAWSIPPGDDGSSGLPPLYPR